MKIGILSDTHGNLPSTRTVARLMVKARVGVVFHCGDIGSSGVLAELSSIFHPLDVPVYAVFGNVDTYSTDWKFAPVNRGIHLFGRFGEAVVAGKKIALLHSDDRVQFSRTVKGGEYDFVLSGHSHTIHDYTVGHTRCINPGTAGRGTPNTCAVLDLNIGKVIVLEC